MKQQFMQATTVGGSKCSGKKEFLTPGDRISCVCFSHDMKQQFMSTTPESSSKSVERFPNATPPTPAEYIVCHVRERKIRCLDSHARPGITLYLVALQTAFAPRSVRSRSSSDMLLEASASSLWSPRWPISQNLQASKDKRTHLYSPPSRPT